MFQQRIAVLVACVCFAGCQESAAPLPPPSVVTSPSVPVTSAELDQFLRVIHALPPGTSAEFTAIPDAPPFAADISGKQLVDEFRQRFRRQFDPRRQGGIWARDAAWVKSLTEAQMHPVQFAALTGRISCALTRLRLQNRLDLDRLVAQARTHVATLVERMDRIDRLPVQQRTADDQIERTEAALRLNRAVALLEFAELVKQVPAESQEVVHKYSAQLMPLLGVASQGDPFAELQNIPVPGREILPAGYIAPARENSARPE